MQVIYGLDFLLDSQQQQLEAVKSAILQHARYAYVPWDSMHTQPCTPTALLCAIVPAQVSTCCDEAGLGVKNRKEGERALPLGASLKQMVRRLVTNLRHPAPPCPTTPRAGACGTR